MPSAPGSCKPFAKNEHGHPMVAADATVGYPVDHSVNDGKGGAHPKGNAPITGPIGGQKVAMPGPSPTNIGMKGGR